MRALFLCLCLVSLVAAPAEAGLRELIIPVEPELVGKRAFTDDPLVAIEPSEYRALVSRYEAARMARPLAKETSPIAFSAVSAQYKATVSGGSARLKATLRYHTLSDGPQALPICYSDVALDAIRIVPAAPFYLTVPDGDEALSVVIDSKGPVTLDVTLSAPVGSDRGKSSFGCRLPPFPVQSIELTLPPSAASPTVSGRALAATAGMPSKLDLGGVGALDIEWFAAPQGTASEGGPAAAFPDSAKPAVELPPRLAATVSSLFMLGEETLSMHHQIDLLVTRGRASTVEFVVPANVEVQAITGPLVAEWQTTAAPGGRACQVTLKEALRGETSFTVAAAAPIGRQERAALPLPKLTGAARQQGIIGVSSYAAIELESPPRVSLTPVDASELPATLAACSTVPILLACRYPAGVPELAVRIKRPARAPVLADLAENANAVTILTETDRGGKALHGKTVTTFTKIVLQYVNATRKQLGFRLEPDARITSCFVDNRASAPSLGSQAGEYSLPVPRSSIKDGKLQSYAIQITYQLDLDKTFQQSGTVSYSLPSFDSPIADYSWKVFTPEKYRFFRFRGNLEDTSEDSEFVMVSAAKWLFDRLLYDLAGQFLLLAALFSLGRLIVGRGGSSWRERLPVAGKSLLSLAIVFGIGVVLAAICVPNFRAARERGNFRACFANQKTIAGAIEMYNLDNNVCRTDVGSAFFRELVQGGYLQSIPADPGQGSYSTSNYFRMEDGNGIACRSHGSIQGGPARLYGCSKPEQAAVLNDSKESQALSTPRAADRNDRTNPINFRIPRTGQYTLLLRGFLPENIRPRFDVGYQSAERYSQLKTACCLIGAALAFLLVLPLPGRPGKQAAPGRSAAALALLLAFVLGLDSASPSLASDSFGAWSAALTLAIFLSIFGGRLKRLLGRLEEGGEL